ncbi:PhzF family phenazine biosynthesis protein [Aquiflexum sp. TKW24L]|uniref:PhzF family phenazine biosynthesis protein n=1 Tax=Aquiflexum sp. TKW24L TaxID=2942212 RepID=UPI0020C14E3A|nr:PhzF family phenazine biosynthesis protein [Aquiflexum sp. TKW24L]MCL6258175.1 PhzF family phenazine biosynthesis protein [Aquiflexum sp. TKW24L]
MELKIYQVDAFSDKVFGGNPAAVVPLKEWLEDDILQKIALENNLSETAFYVKEENNIVLRWFTPGTEVDLCGHATLATAHVLFEHEGFEGSEISFFSLRSGILKVRKEGSQLVMDFPLDQIEEIEMAKELTDPFSPKPIQAFKGKTDYILVFENENQIRTLNFDLTLISKLPVRGVIVTAKGEKVDFVSRFFGPQVGVPEDPVTGSAHTSLTPIWSQKLGKEELTAVQVSAREGKVGCKLLAERVILTGNAVTYLIGKIYI